MQKTKFINSIEKYYYLVPILVFLILYFPSLYFDAVWGDDTFVKIDFTKDFRLVLRSFYDSTQIAGGIHYMPLFYMNCFFVHFVFKDNAYPFGFHVYQYIQQAIICGLGTIVLSKISKRKIFSMLVILLWTIHPLNVQNFTRILLGPGITASTLYLFIFFICFLNLADNTSKKKKALYLIFGNLFLLLSFLCGEVQFLMPLILYFIYFCFYGREIFSRKNISLFSPLFIVYPIYFILKFIPSAVNGGLVEPSNDLIQWTETGSIKDILFRAYWLSPQLLVHYLKLFTIPYGLIDSAAEWYKVGPSIFSPYVLFCQFFILILLFSSFYFSKKAPIFSIGLFWFFIAFILLIEIIPLFSIVAVRYTYIPLLGFIMAVCSIFLYIEKHVSRKMLITLYSIILVFLIYRTLYYLPSSKDFLTQQIYLATEAPLWNKARYMSKALKIANEERFTGKLPSWINYENMDIVVQEWIKKYLNIKSDLSVKYGPMQMAYNFNVLRGLMTYVHVKGNQELLLNIINTTLRINNGWMGWYEVATFLKKINSFDSAWKATKNAVKANPKFQLTYDQQFFEISYQAKKFKEAEELILNYIKINSKFAHPFLFAGVFYNEYGFKKEALDYLEQGIDDNKVITLTKSLYKYSADVFIELKMYDKALKSVNKILFLFPEDLSAKELKEKIEKLKNEQ